MAKAKRWTITEADPRAAELAAQLRVSVVTAQVLLNRGLGEAEAARAFLRPSLKDLHDPSLLAGLDVASERIARAVRDQQTDRHLRRLRRGRHHGHGHPVARDPGAGRGRPLLRAAPARGGVRAERRRGDRDLRRRGGADRDRRLRRDGRGAGGGGPGAGRRPDHHRPPRDPRRPAAGLRGDRPPAAAGAERRAVPQPAPVRGRRGVQAGVGRRARRPWGRPG